MVNDYFVLLVLRAEAKNETIVSIVSRSIWGVEKNELSASLKAVLSRSHLEYLVDT